MERGEPVELSALHGVRRVARWHRADRNPHAELTVAVGQLPDGRWYVDLSGPNRQTRAYPGEGQAWDVARRLMANTSGWVEVPAAYDADGQPATPGPWEKIGSVWRRPK